MKYFFLSSSFVLIFLFSCEGQDCTPISTDNTKQEPYKYVCYLRKFNAHGTAYTSTAFLIAPRVLLTNAHNLYNANRYEIAAAHNGQGTKLSSTDPLLTYGMISLARTASNTFYPSSFIKNQRKRTRKEARHFDYGIIILPDLTLYNKLGGFLLTADCDLLAKPGDAILFAGYPGGISSYNSELFQKQNNGSLTGFYENGAMMSYSLGTHKGASGSPILIQRDGKFFVVGIHGYGSGCKNSGVKLTQDILNTLSGWMSIIQ